ncbi:uncharacterized protein N7459_001152 [Penicillium hispanicum]|uniref:uncharacterized protein n=1 Tax=Penicillium hispanicum TaxID=1080232 RepID=UPI002542302C|nr:uncharacterized protein N7459_001152 [Penicillium hispanicum]KAJ5594944.1 hypothetical protein N7459_001152 [Penicillium hispanicum]
MRWLPLWPLLILSPVLTLTHGLVAANLVQAVENDSSVLNQDPQVRRYDLIFDQAVQLLDSMKSSPSCHRVAATRLVASCQTLGGKAPVDPNSHEALEQIRSVYAVRLAICELDDAGAAVPPPCLRLTVSPPPPSKNLFRFTKPKVSDTGPDMFPRELVEQCLRSLESRPQSWTSYSNSRQNAVVICQAAQVETEKEELLNLHRSIVESSFKLKKGLQFALQEAALEASRKETFLQAVQALQEKIVVDLRDTESLLKSTFTRFLHEVEIGLKRVMDTMSITRDHIQTEASGIQNNIRNASHQVSILQESLKAAHEETISRALEAFRAHEQNNIAYRDLASDLHSSLESLVDRDLVRVTNGVATFDASLVRLHQSSIIVNDPHNGRNGYWRLQAMQVSIEQSESKASELQRAQNLQAEALAAQSRMQMEIQFHAQLSQALLKKVTTAAANLQTVIDEATVKASQMPGLRFGGIQSWSLFILFLALLGHYSPKIAISLFFLILGECCIWLLRM